MARAMPIPRCKTSKLSTSSSSPSTPNSAKRSDLKKNYYSGRQGRAKSDRNAESDNVGEQRFAAVTDPMPTSFTSASKSGSVATHTNSGLMQHEPAREAIDDDVTKAKDNIIAGNPLGRKMLGKQVVKWIGDGMAAMAADFAMAEIAENNEIAYNCGVAEPMIKSEVLETSLGSGAGQSFVMQAQHYLNITPMPPGFETMCLRASTHYPTLFDHFQRELQKALSNLESAGKIPDWKQAKAWKLLKLHAKSGI